MLKNQLMHHTTSSKVEIVITLIAPQAALRLTRSYSIHRGWTQKVCHYMRSWWVYRITHLKLIGTLAHISTMLSDKFRSMELAGSSVRACRCGSNKWGAWLSWFDKDGWELVPARNETGSAFCVIQGVKVLSPWLFIKCSCLCEWPIWCVREWLKSQLFVDTRGVCMSAGGSNFVAAICLCKDPPANVSCCHSAPW